MVVGKQITSLSKANFVVLPRGGQKKERREGVLFSLLFLKSRVQYQNETPSQEVSSLMWTYTGVCVSFYAD